MPVAAPADRRFRRAHVHPARKRSWLPGRGTLVMITVACVAASYGGYRVVRAAIEAQTLTITRITVAGTKRLSQGEVLALLDGLRGANVVMVDLEAWRRRLLGSPWVEDASIRRVFPNAVSVAIVERAPFAIARIADALYLIDAGGTIIDEFGPAYADFDLPIIDGLASGKAGATLVDGRRAALAARVLADLGRHPALASRVSQIDVSEERDAAVILEDDTALIRVGDDKFAERVQAYLDLAPRLKEQVPDIDYADMRFDRRIYVRPHDAGVGVQAAGGGDSSPPRDARSRPPTRERR